MIAAFEQARAYTAKLPLAVSGQRGHDATFRVACCLVHGFALSPDAAFLLLCEYNDKLGEKWTERELRHKIEDAGKIGHRHPVGYLIRSNLSYRPLPTLPMAPAVRWPIERKAPPLTPASHPTEAKTESIERFPDNTTAAHATGMDNGINQTHK